MSDQSCEHMARYWTRLDEQTIQCDLCPRACRLKDGRRGFCYVRKNQGGQLVLTTYGLCSGLCSDPIEKKPLYHFYPGSLVLSFGTAGCNLACQFCQNWDLSCSKDSQRASTPASPQQIAQTAEHHHCHSVAFTYNDPIVFAEYAIDTAKVCQKKGIKTVAVTAGYINDPARRDFFEVMDGVNVDLKSFREEFYQKYSQAGLKPVLDTLKYIKKETTAWLEITTLLIPGLNDSSQELNDLTRWVAKELGPDVPLHFSAFHPAHQMTDYPRTPLETLRLARQTALDNGCRFVYTGNVEDRDGSRTSCAQCGKTLIERDRFRVDRNSLQNGCCPDCGTSCPGCFLGREGTI